LYSRVFPFVVAQFRNADVQYIFKGNHPFFFQNRSRKVQKVSEQMKGKRRRYPQKPGDRRKEKEETLLQTNISEHLHRQLWWCSVFPAEAFPTQGGCFLSLFYEAFERVLPEIVSLASSFAVSSRFLASLSDFLGRPGPLFLGGEEDSASRSAPLLLPFS